MCICIESQCLHRRTSAPRMTTERTHPITTTHTLSLTLCLSFALSQTLALWHVGFAYRVHVKWLLGGPGVCRRSEVITTGPPWTSPNPLLPLKHPDTHTHTYPPSPHPSFYVSATDHFQIPLTH